MHLVAKKLFTVTFYLNKFLEEPEGCSNEHCIATEKEAWLKVQCKHMQAIVVGEVEKMQLIRENPKHMQEGLTLETLCHLEGYPRKWEQHWPI